MALPPELYQQALASLGSPLKLDNPAPSLALDPSLTSPQPDGLVVPVTPIVAPIAPTSRAGLDASRVNAQAALQGSFSAGAEQQRAVADGQHAADANLARGNALRAEQGDLVAAEAARAGEARATQRSREDEISGGIKADMDWLASNPVKDRRSAATRAGHAIAAGLGGFAADVGRIWGDSGATNVAGGVIERKKGEDLQAQRDAIGARTQSISLKRQLLGDAQKRGQDDEETNRYGHLMQLEQTKRGLESVMASTTNDKAKAEAAAQIAGISTLQQQELFKLHEGRANKIESTLEARNAAAAARAAAQQKVKPELSMADTKFLVDAGAATPEQASKYYAALKAGKEGTGEVGTKEVIPGFVDNIGLEKPDVTAIRKNAGVVADLQNDYKLLDALRQKNAGGTWNADDTSKAQRITNGMVSKFSQMTGAGAPSESERDDFKATLVDPTGFYLFKDPSAIYKTAQSDLQTGLDARLRSIGVSPRDGNVAVNATPVGTPTAAPAAVAAVSPPSDLVSVINPDTQQIGQVHRSQLAAAAARGFVPGRPSSSAPIPRDDTPPVEPQRARVGAIE